MRMKKNIFIIVLMIQIAITTFVSQVIEKKPWTFLVYMAAANSLSDYAPYDIQEMANVGSSPYINILVYLTIHQEGQPKETRKFYVEKGNLQQIGTTEVRDSGDATTLADAVQWACVNYPSDHLAIDLWNHGSGPLNRNGFLSKGVCYDDDTGNFLTDRDCLNVFSWAQKNLLNGKKIDILTCDACLMASLEMAYTFASCADYFVASEETIPANGYQYAYLLNSAAKQNIDPLSFAKLMVTAYSQEYIGTSDYTLSAMNLNALQPLVDNVNNIADILSLQLKNKWAATARSTIQACTAYNTCLSFDSVYIDLGQFYKNLLQNSSKFKFDKTTEQTFKQSLQMGISLFKKIIVANTTSSNYKQASGLSIYFDKSRIDPSYYNLYWTEHNPNWLQFLKSYLKK